MLQVAALIASLALVALVVALIPVLMQVMRTARAAEQTLVAAEREIRPIASQVQALLQEHRDLAQQATRDLRQVEALTLRTHEAFNRLASLTSALGAFGSIGRALGVAQGLRRGADVFLTRLIGRR